MIKGNDRPTAAAAAALLHLSTEHLHQAPQQPLRCSARPHQRDPELPPPRALFAFQATSSDTRQRFTREIRCKRAGATSLCICLNTQDVHKSEKAYFHNRLVYKRVHRRMPALFPLLATL